MEASQLDILHQVRALKIAKANPVEEAKPIWMVPIDRNLNFVGRETVFEQLEGQLTAVDGDYRRAAALYGLGGIGYHLSLYESMKQTNGMKEIADSS